LYRRWSTCSHVKPIPPCAWIARSHAATAASAAFAPAAAAATGACASSSETHQAAHQASERAIRALLGEATPGIPMHGEESGGAVEGLRWVVDPLDGTTNFIHRFPAVGVSVALVDGVRVVAGAVHAPLLGVTWHAALGLGAVRTGGADRARPIPCERATRNPD